MMFDATTTFDAKLKQMEEDLISILHRMSKDRSLDAAEHAMMALEAVHDLQMQIRNQFGPDLLWVWEPSDD